MDDKEITQELEPIMENEIEVETVEQANGINWRVRVRNYWFWITAIPLVILLFQQVAAIFGFEFDLSAIQMQLLAIVETVFLLLGLLGVTVDMTTKGVSDSDRAMTYFKPM